MSLEAIKKDFLSLGETVLFLQTSEAFDYNPGTYTVMENSLLIGQIDQDETITFPLLGKEDPFSVAGADLRALRNG